MQHIRRLLPAAEVACVRHYVSTRMWPAFAAHCIAYPTCLLPLPSAHCVLRVRVACLHDGSDTEDLAVRPLGCSRETAAQRCCLSPSACRPVPVPSLVVDHGDGWVDRPCACFLHAHAAS